MTNKFLFIYLLCISALTSVANAGTYEDISSCYLGPGKYWNLINTNNVANSKSKASYPTMPTNYVVCSGNYTLQSTSISHYNYYDSSQYYWGVNVIQYTLSDIPDCNVTGNNATWDSSINQCVVPPLPCDDPNLIRDENGTCVCPGVGEEFNNQYEVCLLANPNCPVQLPPSCLYEVSTNTHLRTFYDCVGISKQQEGSGPCTYPGEPDNDADGIPDNLDNDDDNDGYSDAEEAARGTDPNDSGSNTASEEGCDISELGLNEKFSTDCARVCLDDHERDIYDVCQKKEIDIPNDCSAPGSYMGYPFGSITNSYSSCRALINANGGKGAYLSLPSCSTGDMACFYNTSGSPDTNSTKIPLDENSSNSDILGQAALDKLSEIKDNIDITNTSLSGINQAIDYQTSTLGDKLDSLSTTTTQSGNNINKSVNNLGPKLDAIELAINNKPTPVTDMTTTNDLLQQLNDKVAEREEGRTELDTEFSGGSSILNDALFSFAQTKNDIISLANGATPPTVTASGSCALSTAATTFGSISFDFSFMSKLRPYIQFFLNLFLLYITIKLYVIIARDAVKLIGLI